MLRKRNRIGIKQKNINVHKIPLGVHWCVRACVYTHFAALTGYKKRMDTDFMASDDSTNTNIIISTPHYFKRIISNITKIVTNNNK